MRTVSLAQTPLFLLASHAERTEEVKLKIQLQDIVNAKQEVSIWEMAHAILQHINNLSAPLHP